MSVISGLAGRINGQSTVGRWSISHTADLQPIIASNTKGAPVRVTGNSDWTGTYEAWGHTPGLFPGELFQFQGSIDGANGADSGASGAIVDSVAIEWDIAAGAPIKHTVSFSANAALTLGADVVAVDSTDPAAFTTVGTKLNIVNSIPDSPTNADLDDVTSMTLTITADNKAYASSSTAGVMKRVAGNLDATVSITALTDDWSTLPQINDIRSLKLFVNATEFWLIEYVIFAELTDMEVNREGDPVGATMTANFTGFSEVGTTTPAWTEGEITQPDSTKKWAA